MVRHHAAQVAVHIAREFDRAGLGEMYAVRGAQSPSLAFKVRTLQCIPALVIDKAVPDIGVNDTGLFRVFPVEPVEIA